MDAENPHLWGECGCECHLQDENPAYGPGNPDWDHDRERESRAEELEDAQPTKGKA